MTEFCAFFGFLGGFLACLQLGRLNKHTTIQVMNGKISQLRDSVRELEQQVAALRVNSNAG